jgi:2-polyprenyl-6-methoxyphenol hydroxylase-like FAD-dependent oxidoreductase
MRVLISGGGIAGLTLAYWLHQYNITPVVIERANEIRRDGHGIDFFGTGYDVAERMGLIERLAARQLPFDGFVYVNKDGKPIARMDAALIRAFAAGKYMGLMHTTLGEVLYEALEGSVEVRFGRWLVAVEPGPDAVEVTFNDGTTESFDLLIGADGVHSATRALVFGPEEQFSRYLGYTIAGYPLVDRYCIGQTAQMYNEPGRMVTVFCTPQANDLLLSFMYQAAKKEHVPREQRLARLRTADVCPCPGRAKERAQFCQILSARHSPGPVRPTRPWREKGRQSAPCLTSWKGQHRAVAAD